MTGLPIHQKTIKEIGALLATAAHVLTPEELAAAIVYEGMSERSLQTIIAVAEKVLRERGVE